MLIAVATQRGSSPVEVRIVGVADDEAAEEGEAHSDVEPKDGPSPIAPELKELVWGAGAFIVFAVLMRLVLYPRMKKGMECPVLARIRAGHEQADAMRQAAQAEVADYQAQLAVVRAEAARPRRRCPPDARSRTPGASRRGERPHRGAPGRGGRPGGREPAKRLAPRSRRRSSISGRTSSNWGPGNNRTAPWCRLPFRRR